MDQPIIKKITSQKVKGYRDLPGGGYITEVINEGIDVDGNRWRWISEYRTRRDGFRNHFRDLDFQPLSTELKKGNDDEGDYITE